MGYWQRVNWAYNEIMERNPADTPETPFPIYLTLMQENRLAERVAAAEAALRDCHLCGNDCGIDRTQRAGPCGIGATAYVASYGPHLGEEDVLRGWRGSGTIFFTGCNLHCVYCQNDDISQRVSAPPPRRKAGGDHARCPGDGLPQPQPRLPTHVVRISSWGWRLPFRGLQLPLVYNTGGYDAPQALT
jgi:putative pyruvate formate lyase activating enzyme